MKNKHSSERGQAMVLLVLGVVVLLGFTALAIDGGMVYSDRRNAQMASDASSLAGGAAAALYMDNHHVIYGNFTCESTGVIKAQNSTDPNNLGAKLAAINRATDNNYTIDDDIADKHGVTTECGIEDHGGWSDKYLDIKTMVTKDTQTSFAQFIFKGLMRNSVEAVTRVRPRSPAVFGHAIVALNPAGCSGHTNGATFNGTPDLNVIGGGIFSNGCLRGNGTPDISVTDGSVNYVGELIGGGLFPDPEPSEALPPSSYQISPPDCSHPDAWTGTGNQLLAASPLDPGLYCVTGELRVNNHETLIGNGVTIVMTNGDITINGRGNVNLTAPADVPDPAPAIPGIVFYMPQSNAGQIDVNGSSSINVVGTIYAPAGDIFYRGNNDTTALLAQLIGWNVQVGGTADMRIEFNAPQQYSRPAMLELYK